MEMSNKTPQEMLALPYEQVLIAEQEGGFSASIAEFEGCLAEGETAEEALHSLRETAIAWIEAEREEGRDIPQPWALQEFSGKFLVRISPSLHEQIVRNAERDKVSLNQYVAAKLSAKAREDQLLHFIAQKLNEIESNRIQEVRKLKLVSNYLLGSWLGVAEGKTRQGGRGKITWRKTAMLPPPVPVEGCEYV